MGSHSKSIVMLWYLVLFYILFNFISSSNAVHKNNILYRGLFTGHHGLNRPINASLKVFENQWFWQLTDHFHPNNLEPNWEQRYFSSFEYYEEGGPIFIEIDGGWEA